MIKNEVIDAILQRRSVRAYTDQPVTDEQLDTVLECALWAPSGMNRQTTVYAAIRDSELLKLLAEDDRKFGSFGPPPGMKMPDMKPEDMPGGVPGGPGGPGGPQGERKLAYGAPCVILVFNQADSRHQIDPALGEENICIAAHSIGLGTCILGGMGAFDDEANAKLWMDRLGIPEGYKHITSIAIGHPADPGTPKPRRDGRKIVK